MLHSFCADKAVGELLNVFRLAAKYDHLQAVLMIEVGMQGGNDDRVGLVLEIGEFFRQQASVVIVDEGDGANHKRIGGDDYRAHKPVANQITERLGAILIAFRGDE